MNLTIRQKLYGLGLLGLVFSVAVGLSGLWGIAQVSAGVQDVGSTSSAIRNHMEASAFLDLTRADVSKMLTASGDAQDTATSELADHQKLFQDRLAAALSQTRGADARKSLDEEISAGNDYVGKAAKISDVRKNASAAGALLGDFLQNYQDLRDKMDAVNDKLQAESKRSENDANRVAARSKLAIMLICVLSSVLLFVIAFRTARGINLRLAHVSDELKKMAAGDLTHRVEDHRKDELGAVAGFLNQTIEKLHDTISQVTGSAGRVSTASEELLASSADTAGKAREQREQAAQVAHAMVEMVTVVSQVSENSHRAAESAQQAVAAAQSGGKIVNETLEEIHLISTSVEEASKRVRDLGEGSKQIGEISGVIDDIADQTNLLALNAAIEAARAGEQGRGFAVVADEVRKLAERTAHATAEIAQKIKRIQEETISTIEAMDAGTDLVKEGVKKTILAGDALKEIVRLAGIVGEMVNQIAAATTEQSSAVAEVNTTIDRITSISNETAAASEDAAKSCDSLSQLATGLRKLVGQFTLSDSPHPDDERSSATRRKPPIPKAGQSRHPAEQESVFELSERSPSLAVSYAEKRSIAGPFLTDKRTRTLRYRASRPTAQVAPELTSRTIFGAKPSTELLDPIKCANCFKSRQTPAGTA